MYLVIFWYVSQDEQRRKTQPNLKGKRTIQLDAVYNTKCIRCGTGGHLAKDCFKVWEIICAFH